MAAQVVAAQERFLSAETAAAREFGDGFQGGFCRFNGLRGFADLTVALDDGSEWQLPSLLLANRCVLH